MNRHLFGVLLILAGVFAVCLAPEAEGCEPRAVYVAPVKKVVVVKEIVAVPAVIVTPFITQVQVPAYSVGYDYQGVQQQQLLSELQQLRLEVARLRVQPNAVVPPQDNVQPPKQTQQTNTASRSARGLAVLNNRCSACHSEANAIKSKSDTFPQGVLLLKGGQLVDLDKNAGRIIEQIDGDRPKMPKGGKLTDREFADALYFLAVKEDDPKPMQPPAKQ